MPSLEAGYELIDNFLTEAQVSSLIADIQSVSLPVRAGGIRNAEKKFLSVKKLALFKGIRQQVSLWQTGPCKSNTI